jgi:protein-tyrosine-phosphatase
MGARVLFVCLHGSAKSLMAAEYFNRMAAARGIDTRAESAGLEPDDAVPPGVVKGMASDGFDVRARRPRRPTPADVDPATTVVTFACDVGALGGMAARVERWDDVPAVSADFTRARDAIVARVGRLLADEAAGR